MVASKEITIKVPDKAIVAIILAVLGFAWNKYEGYSEKEVNRKVEQVMYEHLQKEIAQLRTDLASLQVEVRVKHTSAPTIRASSKLASVKPTKPIQVSRRVGYPQLVKFAQKAPVQQVVDITGLLDGSTE